MSIWRFVSLRASDVQVRRTVSQTAMPLHAQHAAKTGTNGASHASDSAADTWLVSMNFAWITPVRMKSTIIYLPFRYQSIEKFNF